MSQRGRSGRGARAAYRRKHNRRRSAATSSSPADRARSRRATARRDARPRLGPRSDDRRSGPCTATCGRSVRRDRALARSREQTGRRTSEGGARGHNGSKARQCRCGILMWPELLDQPRHASDPRSRAMEKRVRACEAYANARIRGTLSQEGVLFIGLGHRCYLRERPFDGRHHD